MNLFNIIKFGLIFILVSFLSILFNIVMGFIGIQFFYGTIVALLITIISIYFKVILPLYIGSFFGMIHVLEWHWLIATLICLPGLFFILSCLQVAKTLSEAFTMHFLSDISYNIHSIAQLGASSCARAFLENLIASRMPPGPN